MAQKEKTSKVLLYIIIFFVFILAGLMGSFYYFYEIKISKEITQTKKQENTSTINKEINKLIKIGPLYSLKPFVLHLRSLNKTKKVVVKLNLELNLKELKYEIDAKKTKIRNEIKLILTSKTFEDLSTAFGKKQASKEIKEKLNSILLDGDIKNVYWTQFYTLKEG